MRMKIKSVFLRGTLSIAVILIVGLSIRIRIGTGTVSQIKYSYLKEHCLSLKPEAWAIDSITQNAFKKLYGDEEYDVFIYGEEHGYNYSHLFDLQYFKYLNEEYGVSVYLDEISTSSALMLDDFINAEKCDTSILNIVLRDIQQNIPQRYTWDYYNKWLGLRDYNIQKDSTNRIHVKGLLPEDYFEGKYSSRDDAMSASFDYIRKEFQGPYYCSVGQFHAMRDTISSGSEFLPFAGRLEKEGIKVHSTILIPASSYSYYPDGSKTLDGENGPFCYTFGIKNLMRCSQRGELALFMIDRQGTPYDDDSKDFVRFSSLFNRYGNISPVSGHYTTDYFQSILLVFGLDAPQEYKKSLDAPL